MSDQGPRLIGDARLTAITKEVATIETAKALPPGCRVVFEVPSPSGGDKLAITGKVVRVTRAKEGGYELAIRLHTLTAAQREALSV